MNITNIYLFELKNSSKSPILNNLDNETYNNDAISEPHLQNDITKYNLNLSKFTLVHFV